MSMKKIFGIAMGFSASILFIGWMNKMMLQNFTALPESYAGAHLLMLMIMNVFFAPLFIATTTAIGAMLTDRYHKDWCKSQFKRIITKIKSIFTKFRCHFFGVIYKMALKMTGERG